VSAAVLGAALCATPLARAQVPDVPSMLPSPGNLPPGEIPPVPDPSPVVLGGVPTPPDRVGAPLVWTWRRFGLADYAVTAVGGGLTLAMAIAKPRSQHSLEGGIPFDEDVRDALRADDVALRYAFRDASDVGVSLLVTWPFFTDSLLTAWWYRGSRDVAQEMALISFETIAVTSAVQGVTNVLVSRERPYGRTCGTDELPADAHDCTGYTHYRSFFSGHSALSFTGAALVCTHHFRNELLGSPGDALSCAGAYAVAASTATFRVVSDVHYSTDVLTGALVGTVVGYGVPLLHYGFPVGSAPRTSGVELRIVPAAGGLGVTGVF
jgi:membrane-associated phospholipid phosphatase